MVKGALGLLGLDVGTRVQTLDYRLENPGELRKVVDAWALEAEIRPIDLEDADTRMCREGALELSEDPVGVVVLLQRKSHVEMEAQHALPESVVVSQS